MRPERLRMLPGTPMPDYACLRCGHEFDLAAGVGVNPAAVPTEGSLSLCIRCGDVAFFTGQPLRLRAPTAEERAAIDRDPEIGRVRAILAQAIAERPS